MLCTLFSEFDKVIGSLNCCNAILDSVEFPLNECHRVIFNQYYLFMFVYIGTSEI